MRRDSERCVCGHVRGGHHFAKRMKVWGSCLRCPFGRCRQFQLATAERPAARPDSGTLANVYLDTDRHTVAFLLDEPTANAVVFAVRSLAAEYEAHGRELRAVAMALPMGSYGASNRHHVANRLERVAARLRAVEGNYRKAG
jgi:hypothetical protein